MLTEQDFIKAGYRKFKGYTGHENSDYGLQKLIADEIGKRYYITVSVYDWTKYPLRTFGSDFTFSPHFQIKTSCGMTTNIELICHDTKQLSRLNSIFTKFGYIIVNRITKGLKNDLTQMPRL